MISESVCKYARGYNFWVGNIAISTKSMRPFSKVILQKKSPRELGIFVRFLASPAHSSLCPRKGIQHARFDSGAERRGDFRFWGSGRAQSLTKSSTGTSQKARRTLQKALPACRTDRLDRPVGQTGWTDRLDWNVSKSC